ncbi:carbon storage regulator CsrA [Candidatus Albibeggiatoa sp. nov. NOAA]|uniref:carbon storage regulator CsrA n=1 Tax=Candidatus Albibeggiatoa sp. nov. NOAA TaxID=3162724 RepID=UPI0032FD4DAE|nr:carbon storage regulator CsrA [Thiotrichaceae bacterium]
MLILKPKLGETLRIGDDISVTISGISRNQVKFAINAPKSTAVHREEVYRQLQPGKQIKKTNEL